MTYNGDSGLLILCGRVKVANVFFIYILECSNGAYYTGYTTDMKRRYAEHQQGSARCKYTRSFPPKRIAACWQVDADLSNILKIERQIKSLSKKKKMHLAEQPDLQSQLAVIAKV